MLDRCIQQLGRGVGNIVAQQYGFSSEAIDVTASPEIAAFFATRVYPHYETAPPDTELGVIYRFTADVSLHDADALEARLRAIGHREGDEREAVWFRLYTKESDLTDEQKRDLQQVWDRYGKETLELATCPVVVTYSYVAKPLMAALKKAWGLRPRDLRDTRLSRQNGGFIRPRVFWRCTVPQERSLVYEPELGCTIYVPSIAKADELVAIEDILIKPGCDTFFFRHGSGTGSELTREYLWPGIADDDLYNQLTDMIHVHPTMSSYLEQKDIWIEHPTMGILDRGYYTGAEEDMFRAVEAYHFGRYPEAIERWTKALAIHPGDDQLLVSRAGAYIGLGRLDEAMQDLDAALRLNPRKWDAFHNKGIIYKEQKDLNAALTSFTRCLDYNPRSVETYLERGMLYGESGVHKLALQDIELAWKYAKRTLDSNLHAKVLQTKALALTAAGKYEETPEILRQLEKLIDTARLRQHLEHMRAGLQGPQTTIGRDGSDRLREG
jgi:tetratricopeptide (TPR) repeat protein